MVQIMFLIFEVTVRYFINEPYMLLTFECKRKKKKS